MQQFPFLFLFPLHRVHSHEIPMEQGDIFLFAMKTYMVLT